jgi:uncharacterized protein (DUF4415 family)
MSEKHITKRSAEKLKKGKTDFARIRTLTDQEIASAVADDPDAASLDIDWSKAELVHPTRKKPVSIRLDEDIITYFKKMGRGYQTRINAVLRSYIEHQLRDEG